ncbi:MAG TPA: hypothetical protein VF868_03870 [Bacteroidia bacterium]
MKKISNYILSFILISVFSLPADAQTSANNYDQAQAQLKSEKQMEKSRRKRERKAEKSNTGQLSNDAQHGWLFKKKRKKQGRKEGGN